MRTTSSTDPTESSPARTAIRTGRTRRGALAAAAISVLAFVGTACDPPRESTNLGAVNQLRASVAVPDLVRVDELDAKARAQADRMAAAGTIFHSSDLAAGVSGGWRSIGENVAAAGSIEAAEAALEASAPHYANLTNADFNQVGIGVTERDGVFYLVQVFVGR